MTRNAYADEAGRGWDGAKLVSCLDGPRAGAWYFLEGPSGWIELRRLAHLNGESPHTGRTLGYVTTPEKAAHPRNAGVSGFVLVWAPHRAS